jgi:cleavage stimulation factor subunit 2
MSRGKPEGCSVFFNNVPLGVTERQLRSYFETTGHVVGFRLIQPQPGRESQFGFVDYVDPGSASTAVKQLDGFELAGKRLKVSLSSSRKRDRRGTQMVNPASAADAGGEEAPPLPTGPPFTLPRGYHNPVLGADNPVDACLVRLPQVLVYEAVEQLRLLALERPTEASLLLEAYPQLRAATVTVLQQAGRLPLGPLPSEALVAFADRGEQHATPAQQPVGQLAKPAAAQLASTAPATVTAAKPRAAAAAPPVMLDDATRKMVEQILEKLPPEKVEKLLAMTDADVLKIPDPGQRRQVAMLRQHLLPLLNEGQ